MALDRPGPDFALPSLHIADVVADATAGYAQVGILGTRYTMDGPLYPAALGARGIGAVLPRPADRDIIDRIIFDELVNGVITEAARRGGVRPIG